MESQRRRDHAGTERLRVLGPKPDDDVTVNCRPGLEVGPLGAERGVYDLVLCDPPYEEDRSAALAPDLTRVLAENGLLVYETPARVQPEIDGLNVRTSRKYGSARLTLFER